MTANTNTELIAKGNFVSRPRALHAATVKASLRGGADRWGRNAALLNAEMNNASHRAVTRTGIIRQICDGAG